MSIKYTKQQILDKLEQAKLNMDVFYQQKFVNYIGKTIDTKDDYSEIIAEWLVGNLHLFVNITKITRSASYKTSTHNGWTTADDSNRLEERTAMAMYRQRGLSCLGLVLDYQTPLKDINSNHAGKIDLLTYDGVILRIMEMKNYKSKETMLRCVLEAHTYLKTVDIGKLLQNFQLPPSTKVQTCPFVFNGGFQYNEMRSHRPHLKHLMELLDSEPYFYEKAGEHYIVKH